MAVAVLDAHVAGCAGCRSWLADAQRVTRLVRVQSAQVPDLTARVLAAVAADPAVATAAASGALVRGWRQIMRVALLVATLGQLLVAIPVLLTGFHVTGDVHASREVASFDIALAIGFALAAYRPQQVRAVLPVACALAVCLAASSGIDIFQGRATFVSEAGHLVTLAQALLLWALSRTERPAVAVRLGRPATV